MMKALQRWSILALVAMASASLFGSDPQPTRSLFEDRWPGWYYSRVEASYSVELSGQLSQVKRTLSPNIGDLFRIGSSSAIPNCFRGNPSHACERLHNLSHFSRQTTRRCLTLRCTGPFHRPIPCRGNANTPNCAGKDCPLTISATSCVEAVVFEWTMISITTPIGIRKYHIKRILVRRGFDSASNIIGQC